MKLLWMVLEGALETFRRDNKVWALSLGAMLVYLLYSPIVTSIVNDQMSGGGLLVHSFARFSVYAAWVVLADLWNAARDKAGERSRFYFGLWLPIVAALTDIVVALAMTSGSTPPRFLADCILIFMGGVFYGITCGLFANPCKTRIGAFVIGVIAFVLQFGVDIVLSFIHFYGPLEFHMS